MKWQTTTPPFGDDILCKIERYSDKFKSNYFKYFLCRIDGHGSLTAIDSGYDYDYGYHYQEIIKWIYLDDLADFLER